MVENHEERNRGGRGRIEKYIEVSKQNDGLDVSYLALICSFLKEGGDSRASEYTACSLVRRLFGRVKLLR